VTAAASDSIQARRIGHFARYMLGEAGPRRAGLALGFLTLGTITEGISILMLVPILHMVGEDARSIALPVPGFLASLAGEEIEIGLLPILALLVAIVFVQALFVRFKNIYMAELLYDVINRLRIDLFERIGQARWQYVAGIRGSELHHGLTADIDRVHNAAFRLLLLTQGLVLLAGYFVVSCLISPAIALLAFATGSAVLAVLQPIRRRAAAYGRLLTRNRQDQYRTVHEFLTGIKVAKSFNAEPRYVAELAATLGRMRDDFARFVRVNSLSGIVFHTASAIVLVAFVYVALTEFALSLPHLIVLVFVFMRVLPRFTALQSDLQEMLVNIPAFDAMREIAAECERQREPPTAAGATPPTLGREIRFEEVTFRYDATSEESVLDRVSFSVPARHITAIIGPSGSGKSTLADLLMGLIEPASGTIAIDGTLLDGQTRRSWRGAVAYVPQEVFLLNDTIEANLRLAAPDASESAMWEALRAAQAEPFVARLPDRLQTIVGDRGARLSGGERQRIALARALIRRPQLLILDEATSALDWETQQLVARAIEELRGSMTIVTIAHRLSMIAFADWVVALEEGRVVETGAYESLIGVAGSQLSRLVAGERAERRSSAVAKTGS
jgi:ATP-binding cassette subfamily C protein